MDPYGLGVALLAALGGADVEARARRRDRAAFRAAWFEAQRSLLTLERWVDEFETYVLEDGYGGRAFRVGSVRLVLTTRRAHSLKDLWARALATAHRLGDDLDGLSEFLGLEDEAAVAAIVSALDDLGRIPERYADLLAQGRAILAAYRGLLDGVAVRERFREDAA